MAFLENKNFEEILFKSSIASMAIYEKDPKEYLIKNSSFSHNIEKICFSQSYNNEELKYFNNLHHVKYLIIDDDKNKRLYVSFSSTQTLQDVLNDVKIYAEINRIKGRFHIGFNQLAEIVPLEYFISKLVVEDYELIFTGHSLGAAIAAMITIKILYRPQMTRKYSDKILFIGYGCPSLADIYFKEENDQTYKDNFIFIKNENDIVVDILDYISFLIYFNRREDLDSLNLFSAFFDTIFRCISNKQELTKQIIEPFCKQFISTFATTRFIMPKLEQFGSLFSLTKSNTLKSVEKLNFDIELFQVFFNPGRLIIKIQDHFIDNYFRKLKDKYFQNRIKLINRNNNISINDIKELLLEINLKEPELEMYRNRDNTVVKLNIEKNNNIDHLIAIKLILGGTTIHFEKDLKQFVLLNDDCIELEFICSNYILYDLNGQILHENLTFIFYSCFNKIQINMKIDPKNLKDGLNQKTKIIKDMPFDLLYLHAAFYIYIMNRMGSNNVNKVNERFLIAKDKLLNIFDSLDEILREIRVNENYIFTENDKQEIKNLVLEYLDDLKINQLEKNVFIEIFKNIEYENNLIGFRRSIELAENPEELLKKIVPYLYEIKKRKFRISTISKKLFNKIYNETFFQKLDKDALSIGFLIAGLGIIPIALLIIPVTMPVTIPLLTMSTIILTAATALECDVIEKYYKLKCTWGENKVYKEIVMSIDKNNSNKAKLSDCEKKFDANFINNWPLECDHAIFRIINLTSQVRDILCENNIIGTIGTKKNGKSTFVKLISNQNVPTSSQDATLFATAYSICENNRLKYDNTIIIDYPHFNNSNLVHKLEFYFTRFLLGHIYLIFPAKNNGETDDEKDLYKLITSDKFFGVTFLYNESDAFYINNDSDDIDNIRINFDEKKIRIRNYFGARINEEIQFTCMLKQRIINGYKDNMIRDGVLLEEDLRNKVYKFLTNLENELGLIQN